MGPLPDRSIFDKTLPSSWDAITSIDLNTGHTPVDKSYLNVTHHNKWAIPWMEDDPDLTAPQLWVNRTLQHMDDAKTYGCNGLLGIHWRTKGVGPQIAAMAQKSWDPSLDSIAFWKGWATAHFGSGASPRIADVFSSVDSTLMPTVVGWSGGPGKMVPRCTDMKKFAFVDELESVSSGVTGAANSARFAYWLDTFNFMRSLAAAECAWSDFNGAMKVKDKVRALDTRRQLVANTTQMIAHLQRTIYTVGELGTYMNIESHSLTAALTAPSGALEQLLGTPLPADALPPHGYTGDPRLIVPVVRGTAEKGTDFTIRAVVLAEKGCSGVTVYHRPLGTGSFSTLGLPRVARSVFSGQGLRYTQDWEWYGEAECAGKTARFPAGAPAVTQTVVMH